MVYDSKEIVEFKYQSLLKFLWHDKNSTHPFSSQSRTKEKNEVKFLFLNFFVVPWKVLWRS